MFHRLRFRLTVIFIGLAVVPLFLVVVVVVQRSVTNLEQQSLALQRAVTDGVGSEIEAFFDARQNELSYLNEVSNFVMLDVEEQRDLLGNLLLHQNVYQDFVLIDDSGQERIRRSRTGRTCGLASGHAVCTASPWTVSQHGAGSSGRCRPGPASAKAVHPPWPAGPYSW